MKHIPTINFFYWAFIVSANTIGETAGDLISQTFHLGYGGGTIALITLFFLTVGISIFFKNPLPFIYWTIITLASTAGTTLSDYVSRTIGLGYLISTLVLLALLFSLFSIWKIFENRNNLKNSFQGVTQLLYWLTMLTSSTLGTSIGDLLAHDTPLGFGGGTVFLIVLLALVILLVYTTKLSRLLCYWLAIIITHPIGATIGDYLTKEEGFSFGNTKASIILTVVFIVIISTEKLVKYYVKQTLKSKSLHH